MAPRLYVEAPPVTPLPFGLFSAAVLLDDAEGRWGMGGVEYEPDYCGPAFLTEGACAPVDLGYVRVYTNDLSVSTAAAGSLPSYAAVFTVDWGDGTVAANIDPDAVVHTYAAAGNYVVTFSGPEGFDWHHLITVAVGSTTDTGEVPAVFRKDAVDGIGTVEADPFTVYHLFRCRLPAGGAQRGMDRARAALRLGESRAVEQAVAHQLSNDPDGVDITPTPGTAVGMVDAVALLEQWSASHYGGQAVIHAPRGVASVMGAAGVAARQNTRLETKLGTPIAAGAGYAELLGPEGTAPGDTHGWLYVTGQVVVRRSSVIEVNPTFSTRPATNEFVALAERPYVVTTECIVGAVLVKTPYGVPS